MKNISETKTRITHGGHVFSRIKTKQGNFVEDLAIIIPAKFGSN
jgi:hypothetical protein